MTRKILTHSVLIGLLACGAAPSHALYKCEADGKVSYSDQTCAGGKPLPIHAAPADAESAQRQIAQEKQQVEQLEKARHKRESAEYRERQQARKANAAQTKKCASLARREKQAAEDAAAATGKAVEKARRKAQRISEDYLAECGRPDALGIAY